MLTKEEVIKEFGFKELPHFTVMGSLIYELGRGRFLSLGCVGTPNEVLFIGEENEDSAFPDAVCLHNYDYDGYLTKDRLRDLMKFFWFSPYNSKKEQLNQSTQ